MSRGPRRWPPARWGGIAGAEILDLPGARGPNAGPCFHLGGPIGLRDCATCRGSVRVKVYACRHPLHAETTLRECQACPDFDAQLTPRGGGVATWSVGVTTAPRDRPTLARCLRSLAAAGWPAPRLFAEPGAAIPAEFAHLPTSRRDEPLGEWPNWFLGLAELYQRDPGADAYLMIQDDVVFARNLRAFLEADLWPAPRLGLVSPYCAAPYAAPEPGWRAVDAAAGLVGALAILLPNASARALLADPRAVAHRRAGARGGTVDTDGLLGRWAHAAGLPAFVHSPSLAQHIGVTSTVWPGAPAAGVRRAADFVGEAADALDFLPRATPPDSTNHVTHVEILEPPLVSCLMPTADRRAFVRLSLDLFRAQDYPNTELIVVDDGADALDDLLAGVPGVRHLRLDGRATIGAKRNLACAAARGEVFVHWDDDDWYAPGRLRHQVGPILADEADLTGLENAYVLALPDAFWTARPDLHRRMFVGDVHGGTLAFHRSLWDEGLRYPEADLAEDAGFLNAALDRGKRLARLGNPGLFVYVRHGRNAWSFAPGRFLDPAGWSRIAPPPGFPLALLGPLGAAAGPARPEVIGDAGFSPGGAASCSPGREPQDRQEPLPSSPEGAASPAPASPDRGHVAPPGLDSMR